MSQNAKNRSERRVAITGIGLITPIGRTFEELTSNLAEGHGAIRIKHLEDKTLPTMEIPLAQVLDFDPETDLPNAKAASMDRVTQFTVFAGRNALKSADVAPEMIDEVFVGTSTTAVGALEQSYDRLYRGNGRIPPLTIPKSMPNATACATCIDLGIKAPSVSVSSACGSSNQAIIHAAQKIRYGIRDRVLVGGAEASLAYSNVSAWKQMRVLAPDTCRPFCATRKGLVLGEGAVLFVLEEWRIAEERGAMILGEIIGWGENTDAGSLTTPQPAGIADAISRCLEDAKLNPGDVDLINAHGTGTPLNDSAEAAAIQSVFERRLETLKVRSTKALHGHLLGGAGAIEMAACLAAMKSGIVPPSANIVSKDEGITLAMDDKPRRFDVQTALSNSFAFGGHNSVLALSSR